jgi:hypothetical protein
VVKEKLSPFQDVQYALMERGKLIEKRLFAGALSCPACSQVE